MTSIKNIEHILSEDGRKISDEKLKVVVNALLLKDASQLHSFLGLSQFCVKFVPQFATVTSPLWDLTKLNGNGEKQNKEPSHNSTYQNPSDGMLQPQLAYQNHNGCITLRIRCNIGTIATRQCLETNQLCKQKTQTHRI